MSREIHYVKGYKSPLKHMPKEIMAFVIAEYLKQDYDIKDIDKVILEVDLYINVDLRNCYLKE